MISPSGTMIQRDYLKDLGGFDPNFTVCEDYELWLHITASHHVAFVDEPLVIKNGGHPDQLSQKYLGMEMWRILAILQLLNSNNLSTKKKQTAHDVFQKKITHTKNGMIKYNRKKFIEILENMEENQNSLNNNASTSIKNLERLSESLKLEMESMAVTA